MNILHIISAPASGGAEVYVKDLAKFLSQQGHSIHIAFLSNASDAGRDVEYENFFLEDLRSAGVNFFTIGNKTRKKPWLGMLRLRKYVLKNNIHICHTHLAYGIFFSSVLQIPVAYTHHIITPRWGKLMYAVFNRLVDEYIGISEICATALRRYTGKKVTTIMNAVAEDKFSQYIRQRVLKDTVNFAMVGRLDVQKDYMNMLNALTLLDVDTKNKVKVWIAGEGNTEYKNELLNYVDKNRLHDIVEFVGVKKNIPKFLYDADIFLMSSSFEGLPIALIEAAVVGLPCIITDVGGCSEVIAKSNNGVAVPPHNPQAIANQITRFVLDRTLIEQFSTNAIDNSHKYSISTAAQLHLELYTSMIK